MVFTPFEKRPEMASAWLSEFEEATAIKNFFTANYPVLAGNRMDLFKVFLPLAWRNASKDGVQGFLHPLTNFTETKGVTLRKNSYSRLRYLFKFANEENLFEDVDHHTKFAVAVYGRKNDSISALAIMNLFHPKTVDDTFESTDNSIAEGIKDENGNWNHKGQKDRLITLDREALETIGRVFSDSLTAPVLPDIHSETLLNLMEKFSKINLRIRDLGEKNFCISSMWQETGARIDGIIAEFPKLETKTPESFGKLILNGPHLNVGNPFFKTPRNPCKHNLDWVPVDLELIPDDFIARCKYEQKCNDATYMARQMECNWDKKPFDKHWRLAYRCMIGSDSERSLTSAIYPPSVGHIHKVSSLAFSSNETLITVSSEFCSLPLDSYVRFLGKTDLLPTLVNSLPFVNYRVRFIATMIRCLSLMCLTEPYKPFWESQFKSEFLKEQWTQQSAGLIPDWFAHLTPQWTRNCALRSDLMRRQALLELDVLTAQAMGLDFQDLITLYRLRFRVMRDYEANTWYDQNGRIVFTNNSALPSVGLPRKKRSKDADDGITYRKNGYAVDAGGLGFEDVKDMKEGYIEKTFPDISMSDEPVMTTVKYVAPFFQMDREADYRRAWEVFEKRFGKVNIEDSESSTENQADN